MDAQHHMSSARRLSIRAAIVVVLPALLAATAATSGPANSSTSTHDRGPTLVGRAVLPFDTLAEGPPAGAFVIPGHRERRHLPAARPSPSRGSRRSSTAVARGEYLAMADNGFGTKANSRDFLIRAYYQSGRTSRPPTAARGGAGRRPSSRSATPRLIGFPIVNEDTMRRLLTGGDIDPESLQRGRHGDLWVGDEFGPWILHFDRRGRLLDPPFAMPGGIMSPNNPFLNRQPATHPNSRGLEAMAITRTASTFTQPWREPRWPTRTSHGASSSSSAPGTVFTGRALQYRTEAAATWSQTCRPSTVTASSSSNVTPAPASTALFRQVYLSTCAAPDAAASSRRPLVDLTASPIPTWCPFRHPPWRPRSGRPVLGDVRVGRGRPPHRRERLLITATTTCRTPAETRRGPTTTSSSSSTCHAERPG